MRIISGIYKNTKLQSPNSDKTHPMGDREKLALFNMLTPYLDGAIVLDAFAGTGALGLEAMSRGARHVTFVEKSSPVAHILETNLKITLKNDEIVRKSARNIIGDVRSLRSTDFPEKFTLIIADPPYDLFSEALISPLVQFLAPSGVLALSMPKTSPTPSLEGLEVLTEKTYASAKIVIYK